jgi:hypothetical protein
VLQYECLTPFYLSPMQNILPFYLIGIKADTYQALIIRECHTTILAGLLRCCM